MTYRVPRRAVVAFVRSRRWRAPRHETGASLVEFAIILPVFALMLFAMIQFGLTFAGWDQLRNAVQTGARVAANNPVTTPGGNCGQVDAPSNMVCQIAFLIGSPVGTNPTPVETSVDIPSSAGCSFTLTSTACTGPTSPYSWLDGYYVFHDGQWLQIVNGAPSSPSTEIMDSTAFADEAGTWQCTQSADANCTSMTTNVSGHSEGALGSDNIVITTQTNPNLLEVCAQRETVSFTALPGLQSLHLSTSSSFYLTSTASVLGCSIPCSYPQGSTCG